MDEHRSGSPSHQPFTGPVKWAVRQSTEQLIVDRIRGHETDSFRYVLLDKPAADTADTAAVSSPSTDAPPHRAYWDGDRLVLETIQTIQGKTVTTREVLTLAHDRRELTVERVVEVEHGYTMKGAQNFTTVKDVFTRASRQ